MHKQSCWHCKPVYCADVPFDASWTRELLRAERHVPTELWLGEAFVWTLHIFSPCHGSLIGCFAEDYRVPTIEFRRCVERCTALVSATFWSIASNFGFQTSNALLSKKNLQCRSLLQEMSFSLLDSVYPGRCRKSFLIRSIHVGMQVAFSFGYSSRRSVLKFCLPLYKFLNAQCFWILRFCLPQNISG